MVILPCLASRNGRFFWCRKPLSTYSVGPCRSPVKLAKYFICSIISTVNKTVHGKDLIKDRPVTNYWSAKFQDASWTDGRTDSSWTWATANTLVTTEGRAEDRRRLIAAQDRKNWILQPRKKCCFDRPCKFTDDPPDGWQRQALRGPKLNWLADERVDTPCAQTNDKGCWTGASPFSPHS